MKILFDIMNSSQVHTLYPIILNLRQNNKIHVIARDLGETFGLLNSYNLKYSPYGSHGGKSQLSKRYHAARMILDLMVSLPKFDVDISMGSYTSTIVSRLKRKTTIVLTDNEYSIALTSRLRNSINHFILPRALETAVDNLEIHAEFFDGFKEHIYLANYKPDKSFIDQLPFDDFITLRPEALQAYYLPSNVESIVPDLLHEFKDENILFLPRYPSDIDYVREFDNIYIPKKPLNGMDICYHSRVVMTGSGTFAREAAVLGVPAVSFYPGKNLLAVDQELIHLDKIFHNRNVKEISLYVNDAQRGEKNKVKVADVQQQVFSIVNKMVNEVLV